MVYHGYVLHGIHTRISRSRLMKKTKEQQKEDDSILLSWEDYSIKYNTYSILAWIVYIIMFIPMLIAWIIIEMRKR